jgi:tetratricopeptide (TPR) repeat protein
VLAWGALAASWVLSVSLSPCPPCGLERLWRWLPALTVLGPLVWMVGGAPGTRVELLRSWGAAGAMATVVLAGEHTFGALDWVDARLSLPHAHPNALAVWLVLSAAASLAWWRRRGGRLPLACFSLCAGGVGMTRSKAGAAGIWLGLMVATTGVRRRALRWASQAVLLMTAAALLPVLVRDYPRSIQDRVVLLQTAARAVLERPLLGWGLGNMHVHLRYAWDHVWNAGVLDWHTHNLYLQTAESSGVLGLGSLLAVLAVALALARGWDRLPLVCLALLGLVDYVLEWPGIIAALVLSLGLAGRGHGRRCGAPVFAAVGAALVVLGGMWQPPGRHLCPVNPVQRLEHARGLWEEGQVSASMEAYLEAARIDPAEEWAVGAWEEGALRCLSGGATEQARMMFARALLVRPQTAVRGYWPRLAAGGPKSRMRLSDVFAWAEWEARLLFSRNRLGGAMLLGNLTRSYYLAGRRDDAERIFSEIRDVLPPRHAHDGRPWDLDTWMEAWLEKQQDLTGRHQF